MSWLTIGAIGAATYALRASFMLFRGNERSENFKRALRFVPVAVLSPLAVSAVANQGSAALEWRLLAAALAAFVSWRTRNAAAAMVAGMLVIWFLS